MATDRFSLPEAHSLVGPYQPHPGSLHVVPFTGRTSLCGLWLGPKTHFWSDYWRFGWGTLRANGVLPPGRKLCQRCQKAAERFSETSQIGAAKP